MWSNTQSHFGEDFIWDSTQGFLSDVQIPCGLFQLPFQDHSISGADCKVLFYYFLFLNLLSVLTDEAQTDSGATGVSGQFDDAEVDHW